MIGREPDDIPLLDTEVDMNNEEFQLQMLRAIRGMNANSGGYRETPGKNVIGIVAICVTIIICALGVSSQFSNFQGEMREWKRATDEWKKETNIRLEHLDQRAERDEQLLFEKLKASP